MNNVYEIVDSFRLEDRCILVLDRDYDSFFPGKKEKVVIDGKEYAYMLNSIPKWVVIKSSSDFAGKQAMFI